MNSNRLPNANRLPALYEQGRAIDTAYYGGGAPEFEPRDASMRSILLKWINLALRHKILIFGICALALTGGFVATVLTPKTYSTSTTVKIDRVAPKVLKSQSAQFDGINDAQFYQTQFELIKSRSLAERVASNLNLAQTDFVTGGSPGLLARLTSLVSPASADHARPRDRAEYQTLQAAAVNRIVGGLVVQPVPLSSLVRIRYSSEDPRWARDISIAVAESFERSTTERRFGATKYARAFLEERLQELKIKLQDSEKQLIRYAQKEGIVNADDKQPQAAAALAGVQSALSNAVMERIRTEQLWEQAQSDSADLGLPQIMTDTIIQAARSRLATMQANYQDKLNVMRPAYPEMQALKAQMNETEKQIRTQVGLIKKSIQAQYEAARAQENALTAKVEQVKADVLELRGRSVEYTILLREVDTARSLYEGVLAQFRELDVSGDVDTNNVSIIDKAELPGAPDSPSLPKNLMISFIFGLMSAAGLIAVREALDDTFKTIEDLEEGLGLPVLGVTPKQDASAPSPIQEIMNEPRSSLAEAFRSLRTALQFAAEEGTPKSLLVTSAKPGEGKSTASAALAVHFAELGMRVLLIDADMRSPSMHELVETDNASGLSTFLSGTTDAANLVKSCAIKGVTFMSSGPTPPNPADLLARPRFASLLATASEAFDIIIIDGPPVMGLADAPVISSMVSGTLLVVEASQTPRGVVRDAVKRIDMARARLVGALLNKFDATKAGYGYGYGSNYGDGAYSYGRKEKTPQLTDA